MIHNRFHKSTLGVGAEIVIAKAVSATESGSAGAASGATPSTAQIPVTIAGSPTAADTVTITVDGVAYLYTVPVSGTTQQAHDGILAMLEANTQGFVVAAHSGTTSSIFNLAWAGADKNAKVVSLAKTGSSFTVGSNVSFAGGANADAVGEDTIALFVASAAVSSVWAYWDDTNLALSTGDTFNAANAGRKFYYAYKNTDGTYKRTSAIPVTGRKYNSIAYNAGTALVLTMTFGGTYSLGQTLTVRIIDKTQSMVPFPGYDYSVIIGASGINQAMIDIAVKINAETFSPIVTATTSTNTLILTGKTKLVSFTMTTYIDTTIAQPTDATAATLATTTAQVLPIGDNDFMRILEQYQRENGGDPLYTNGMYLSTEFSNWSSNVDASVNYGILVVTNDRTEIGEVRNYAKRNYAVVAVVTGDEAKLAAL